MPGRTENRVQGIGIPGLNRRFERVHCGLGGAESLLTRSQQAPGQHQQEGSEHESEHNAWRTRRTGEELQSFIGYCSFVK